jgi:hypothetical protein
MSHPPFLNLRVKLPRLSPRCTVVRKISALRRDKDRGEGFVPVPVTVRARRDQSGGKGVNAMLSAVRKLLASTLTRRMTAAVLLWDQLEALARHLQKSYEALLAEVFTSPLIHADETHWYLLDKGPGKKWYAWTVASPDTVYHRILPSRSGASAS